VLFEPSFLVFLPSNDSFLKKEFFLCRKKSHAQKTVVPADRNYHNLMQTGRITLSLFLILSLSPPPSVSARLRGGTKVCIHLEMLHLQSFHGCQLRQTEVADAKTPLEMMLYPTTPSRVLLLVYSAHSGGPL